MSLINLLDISFKNNPAPIADPYEIEIQFECLESLQNDLEWKLIYVGSGFDKDIELDSLLVGPIPVGVNKFLFSADAIDPTQIPSSDVLGVSVILLTASYDDREFVRVGFYNNNEYVDPAQREAYDKLLAEGTDEEKAAWKFEGVKNVGIQRNILTAKPRVTRFNIKWDNENFNDEPPVQEEDDVGDVVEVEQLGEGEGDEEEDQEELEDEAELEAEQGEEADGETVMEIEETEPGATADSKPDEAEEDEDDEGEEDDDDAEEDLGSLSGSEDDEDEEVDEGK